MLLLTSGYFVTLIFTFLDNALWEHATATLVSLLATTIALSLFSLISFFKLLRTSVFGFGLLSLLQSLVIASGPFREPVPMGLPVQLTFLSIYLVFTVYAYRLKLIGVLR